MHLYQNHCNNATRNMTHENIDQSEFVHPQGHDYNIFKYPADILESSAPSQ